MNYEQWEQQIPKAISSEIVWQFFGYRKSLYLFDKSWQDCACLKKDTRGQAVARQLIRSSGSISANIEEGQGRGLNTREYQQFLRYALGSARETKGWYYRGRFLLSTETVNQRLSILSEIVALLVKELNRQSKKN